MPLQLFRRGKIAEAPVAGMSAIASVSIRTNSSVSSADELLEVEDQAVMTLVKQELHILLKSLVLRRPTHDAHPFFGDSHKLYMSNVVDVDAHLVVIGVLPIANEIEGHRTIFGHCEKSKVCLNILGFEAVWPATLRWVLNVVIPSLRMRQPIALAVSSKLVGNEAAAKALMVGIANVEHAMLFLDPLGMSNIASASLRRNNVRTQGCHVLKRDKGELHSLDGIKGDSALSALGIIHTLLHLETQPVCESLPVVRSSSSGKAHDGRDDYVVEPVLSMTIAGVVTDLNSNIEAHLRIDELIKIGSSSVKMEQASRTRQLKVGEVITEDSHQL